MCEVQPLMWGLLHLLKGDTTAGAKGHRKQRPWVTTQG